MKPSKCPLTGEWTDYSVWYIHAMEQMNELSRTNERATATHDNMDDSQNDCAEWKKLDKREYILCNSMFLQS